MWKGGRLKIEKAKEHFFLRLRREWEQDEMLATTAPIPITAAEMSNTLKIKKKDPKLDEMQLRIYFPKLGKIKPVPLRGTGKHKYSFQRVEVPSLPVHFCDCEEHSGHPDTAKQNSLCDYNSKDGGIDEKELSIMNSVLNRIFERENYSKQAPRDLKLVKKVKKSSTVDHLQQNKNLFSQESVEDDDNLIINVVAGTNDKTTMLLDPAQKVMKATHVDENFDDQEMDEDDDNLIINLSGRDKTTLLKDPAQEAIAAIQNSLSKESRLAADKQRTGSKMSSNRKRKAPPEDEDAEPHTLIFDKTEVCPTEVKSDSQPSNRGSKFPKKSPWKDLISASSGATFTVSDILPSTPPVKEMQSGSDSGIVPCFSNNKAEKMSDKHEEMDNATEDSTQHLDGPLDNYARGAAWRQKSSWTQLVRDTTNTSFSISQILPGLSFPEPELSTVGEAGKVQNFGRTDKSDSRDVSASQEGIKVEDPSVAGTCSGVTFVEGQNSIHPHGELPQFDNNQPKGRIDNEAVPPTLENKHLTAPKQASRGDINFRETYSFMRSAASMKDWMKAKAALSGSHKNKSNEKK